MKRYPAWLLIFMLALSFIISCRKDKETPEPPKEKGPRELIIGDWELDPSNLKEDEKEAMAMFGGSINYSFDETGKVKMEANLMGMNIGVSGDYKWAGDDKIKMKLDMAEMFGAGEDVEASKEEEFTVKVTKDKLELTGSDGETLMLKRKK